MFKPANPTASPMHRPRQRPSGDRQGPANEASLFPSRPVNAVAPRTEISALAPPGKDQS
jgi:hypothetical protein